MHIAVSGHLDMFTKVRVKTIKTECNQEVEVIMAGELDLFMPMDKLKKLNEAIAEHIENKGNEEV